MRRKSSRSATKQFEKQTTLDYFYLSTLNDRTTVLDQFQLLLSVCSRYVIRSLDDASHSCYKIKGHQHAGRRTREKKVNCNRKKDEESFSATPQSPQVHEGFSGVPDPEGIVHDHFHWDEEVHEPPQRRSGRTPLRFRLGLYVIPDTFQRYRPCAVQAMEAATCALWAVGPPP